MFARTLKNEAFGMLALVAAASSISCGDASAMGRGTPAPAPAPASHASRVNAGGDFYDGYEFGLRNGGILVDRLKQATTDQQGCAAVGKLESALLKVTRTVRPPRAGSGGFVAGFYSGYTDSIRETLSEVRGACDSAYSSGDFAGELYGAVACQASTVSVEAVTGLELQPLYAGWSGGSSEVQAGCRASFVETLQVCADGAALSATLEAAISVSCSDSVI